MSFILLIVGFLLLIKGADLFVEGAASIAKKFNVPAMVIGQAYILCRLFIIPSAHSFWYWGWCMLQVQL